MGVAFNIRRGFGVGLPVPETSFEKLGPMIIRLAACPKRFVVSSFRDNNR